MSDRSTTPRGKRPRVQVSQADKDRAIQRIRNGETKAGISRELGVPESTVRGWVKRADQRLAREVEGNAHTATLSHGTAATNSANTAQPQEAKIPKLTPRNGDEPLVAGALGLQFSAFPILPAALAALQQISFSSQSAMLTWLNLFNAGILNFTLIASAASMQSSIRGDSHLTLWQLINTFIEEYEQFHNAHLMRDYSYGGSNSATTVGSASNANAYRSATFADPNHNYVPYDGHVTADSEPDITTTWSTALATVLRAPQQSE